MTLFLWPLLVALAVLCVLWLNRDLLKVNPTAAPTNKEGLEDSSASFR